MAAAALLSAPVAAADAQRGRYLFDAAGCAACHTDVAAKGPPLAGGRALKTPFGVYYSPNITPDADSGIGAWSDADFIRALRHGVAPDGRHYFPVFPYTSYTGMRERDMLDLKAYIFTTRPARRRNRPHDVTAPFGWRLLMGPWKALYFTPGPFRPDSARGERWNRGAYLVRVLGHCGECHTPRGMFGQALEDMALAGTSDGPGGGAFPNITPHRKTGIGAWSDAELHDFLRDGMFPDGDFAGDVMGEVVENSTGRLDDADLAAMIAYLRALAPVENRVIRKGAGKAEKKDDW